MNAQKKRAERGKEMKKEKCRGRQRGTKKGEKNERTVKSQSSSLGITVSCFSDGRIWVTITEGLCPATSEAFTSFLFSTFRGVILGF